MNTKWVFLGIGILLVFLGGVVVTGLKSEETVLSARYEMLACEQCFHMTIEKSQNEMFAGETIIPISDTVDIEKMIGDVALSKETVCLKGRFYKYNLNVFNFSPDGKKFEVLSLLNGNECSGF